MLINPLNISSTPIAILSDLGLKTYAGVSSDDPMCQRNLETEMHIVLSAYGLDGLISRKVIDTIRPHYHKFYCIDDELTKQNIDTKVTLCVIHRVPTSLLNSADMAKSIDLEESPDFDMYRIVVQYKSNKGGMGSVIYETPPNFNKVDNRGEFLSFSNKIYLGNNTNTHIVFLNYSVNPHHSIAASVNLHLFNASGQSIIKREIKVSPFSYQSVDIKNLIGLNTYDCFSYIASANGCSLIPLSVNICEVNGGVSVEHSHPPQAYIMSDWELAGKIKRDAVVKHLGR